MCRFSVILQPEDGKSVIEVRPLTMFLSSERRIVWISAVRALCNSSSYKVEGVHDVYIMYRLTPCSVVVPDILFTLPPKCGARGG